MDFLGFTMRKSRLLEQARERLGRDALMVELKTQSFVLHASEYTRGIRGLDVFV